jgi:putative YphP/YqiW family bacilliredoxin
MAYSEILIAPMREDLTRHGVIETRTPQQVDEVLSPDSGVVMMVINSVCGCAAGKARPGVVQSLSHANRPDKVATVFAGGDIEAVNRVREKLAGYPPSSPSVAIFRGGEPVFLLHRHQIEGRNAQQIAQVLTEAFDRICVSQAS